jgi:hypothetical protein
MGAHGWLALLGGSLVLSGCYASHELPGEGAGDGGSRPHRDAALVGDATLVEPTTGPGGSPSGSGGVPHHCLSPSSATWVLGPDRGCERRTIDLSAPTYACRAPNFDLRSMRGTELRVLRTRPGSSYFRVASEGCQSLVYAMSDLMCEWCGQGSRQLLGDGVLGGFPDDGLIEVLLLAEPPEAPLPPCRSVEVEICFDPDYGAPPWAP